MNDLQLKERALSYKSSNKWMEEMLMKGKDVQVPAGEENVNHDLTFNGAEPELTIVRELAGTNTGGLNILQEFGLIFELYSIQQPFSKMKTIIAACLLFLPLSLQGQKVFKVKYESQANLKVFVVKYESQCDLKVYFVNYDSQADEDGLWFFVEYESQADKKIYFVEYESQADLKIFFVKYESQAGWKNPEKQHLLL